MGASKVSTMNDGQFSDPVAISAGRKVTAGKVLRRGFLGTTPYSRGSQ
jgi:hypothetical protein